jgi:hypothetical protein
MTEHILKFTQPGHGENLKETFEHSTFIILYSCA